MRQARYVKYEPSVAQPKFLSELNRANEFQRGKINLISAPVGSGKSTYVENKLPEEMFKGLGLYVITTPLSMIKEQVVMNGLVEDLDSFDKTLIETDESIAVLEGRTVTVEDMESWRGKKIVMTAQAFFHLVQRSPEVWDKVEILVLDEIDMTVADLKNWVKDEDRYMDPFQRIGQTLRERMNRTLIIGISATGMDRVRDEVGAENTNEISFVGKIRKYEVKETIKYGHFSEAFRMIIESEEYDRIAYFSRSVRNLVQAREVLKHYGMNSYIIVGDNAENYRMTNREREIKRELAQGLVPQFDGVLLFNMTMVRGVNIKWQENLPNFSHVIVNDQDEDIKIQAVGRMRYDGVQPYQLDSSIATPVVQTEFGYMIPDDIVVPEEYMNRYLTTSERRELAKELALKTSDNLSVFRGWTTVEKILMMYGYQLEAKTIDRKKTIKLRREF